MNVCECACDGDDGGGGETNKGGRTHKPRVLPYVLLLLLLAALIVPRLEAHLHVEDARAHEALRAVLHCEVFHAVLHTNAEELWADCFEWGSFSCAASTTVGGSAK